VPKAHRAGYGCEERGAHLYFRHSHRAMQRRFVELADVDSMPAAFIHGNPHLANYAKNVRGAAMVDFDRARYGPFGYDVSRFLVSLSLRRKDAGEGGFLHKGVLDAFQRGYVLGAVAPERGFEEMRELVERSPKGWQRDLVRYLEKNKAWAKRLGKNRIDHRAPRLRALLESYFASRGEQELAERYTIADAAEVPGSLGKLHTLLLIRTDAPELDDYLIDVKEVYDEPDDAHFFNPFDHNGERMVAAGELHAPDWEFVPGWASVDGVEYWVRGIPRHHEKLKGRLEPIQQVDLAFAVASQLGRAHALSLVDHEVDLHARFETLYGHLVEVAEQLADELTLARWEFLAALGRRTD